MAARVRGGIFISYRRQETSQQAGRLYDRLADRFGESQVFIDVATMEPGVDWREEIFRAVAACQVLLAVIGPGWLSAADERDSRRLDDPDDIVRLEIGAALARDVRVIPILVEGAVMPGRADLPGNLAGMIRRNALTIRNESFRDDAGRLVLAIEQVLGLARPDVARATRLLADAERIASSILDEGRKARALSVVAEALAATDPDHAEYIASSITDYNSVARARALSKVAAALAATDPGHATDLFDEAESIARRAPGLSEEGWARSAVAAALAATDPSHAERLARSISDEGPWGAKAAALSAIAAALAATNPDRAERIASSITDKVDRVSALSAIAAAQAATDPGRAERLASSITNKPYRVLALSGVAKALLATPHR